MPNICPTCSKQVYQAEQTIGPGGKIYHKPCLACQSCNKRLDSLSLLEHDLQPYCKSCHLKLFGTRDLRHANLPQAASPLSPTHIQGYSTPTSTPSRTFTGGRTGPYSPTATSTTGNSINNNVSPPPRSRPPPTPSFWATKGIDPSPRLQRGIVAAPSWDDDEDGRNTTKSTTSTASGNTTQRIGTQGLAHAPQHAYYTSDDMNVDDADDHEHDTDHEEHEEVRHALMSELRARSSSPPAPPHSPTLTYPSSSKPFSSYSSSNSNAFSSRSTPSGTRYGVALTGGSPTQSPTRTQNPIRMMHGVVPISPQGTGGSASGGASASGVSSNPGTPIGRMGAKAGWSGSLTPTHTGGTSGTGTPRRWGGGGETPLCARCGGKVYFAEQVKAVDKTFHKGCLRCTDCGTSLDSRSLRDHEGVVVCVRCYNKNYGPQGGGYALLGKAGG